MVPEARLEQQDGGLTPATDGWFVVNVPEAAWVTNETLGDACVIEGDEASFPDLGYTIAGLQPGQAGARHHREPNQENFLGPAGERLLAIEGQEPPPGRWDSLHCPPDTDPGLAGAGTDPG